MTTLTRNDLILAVDDSTDSLSMIHHALDQADLTALVALNGSQALAIAEKMVPDLILMDALMPTMDGFETCRRLKQIPGLATIPVIFMTGLSDAEDVVRGLEAGGVDYVTKPVRPTELIARIRVHLRNARQAQTTRLALDRLGQATLAVNSEGHWRWGTPQAEQLLELDNALRLSVLENVRTWLQHDPKPGDQTKLPDNELRLRYLGSDEDNEYLFRLLPRDNESEGGLLQAYLRLTQREAQVLLWIAHGKTNREIGEILSLSPRTVNKHLEQIFRKLGVENRTAAATMALRCLTLF